jgi:hypothetical protein
MAKPKEVYRDVRNAPAIYEREGGTTVWTLVGYYIGEVKEARLYAKRAQAAERKHRPTYEMRVERSKLKLIGTLATLPEEQASLFDMLGATSRD